ncbi:MAG: hypothetical protein RL456_135 [Pseudomonadota bacterium]
MRDDDLVEEGGIGLLDMAAMVAARWKVVLGGAVLAGGLGFGGAMLVPPEYTARALIMPPQQQQSAAAAAMSSLGALAGLAGGLGVKNTAEQYVALLQSSTVSDRLIDRFDLMKAYDEEYRVDARRELLRNAIISVGKKDGLILIEVDDRSPKRAAEMANAYVDELRYMTNTLAISEAQQRRKFFEQKLDETRRKLTEAQVALQGSGFTPGVLRAEPRVAADGYARLRAETTAAEVRLQTLRGMLAEGAPEVRQQQAMVTALKQELAKFEQKSAERASPDADADYIQRYREYKYQETLFDLYAKQFELARMDEGREGALIQVVDVAQPPEKKSKPKRGVIALVAALVAALGLAAHAVVLGVRARSAGRVAAA